MSDCYTLFSGTIDTVSGEGRIGCKINCVQ